MQDETLARAAALLAAAINYQGRGLPAAELTGYAGHLVPWFTPGRPARMTLTIEGDPMPLNIDSANAKAVLMFVDRVGDKVAPPDGTVARAVSSNPAVMTVGPAAAGTDQASGAATIEFPLTEVAAGTATLTVHATAADGTPLLGPDAATPITDAAPVTVTVSPGAAAAERFTVPDAGPGPLGSAQAAQGQPGGAASAGPAAAQPSQQPDQPPAGQAPTAEQADAPPAEPAGGPVPPGASGGT